MDFQAKADQNPFADKPFFGLFSGWGAKKPHALILARGGSKGIPRKNIKPLNGVPLLVYNVKACLASGVFEEVVVSSDDDEILAVAKKAGAATHKRSAASAADTASSEAGIFDYVDAHPDLEVCCLVQCTSPLTAAEDFSKGYAKFNSSGADSLVTVVRATCLGARRGGVLGARAPLLVDDERGRHAAARNLYSFPSTRVEA